ncbi:unnamed protein product, partial [Urochloa humidicola]
LPKPRSERDLSLWPRRRPSSSRSATTSSARSSSASPPPPTSSAPPPPASPSSAPRAASHSSAASAAATPPPARTSSAAFFSSPIPTAPHRRKLHLVPLSPPSSSSSAAAAGSGGDFALSFLPGTWEFLDCRNGRFLLKNKGSVSLPAAPTGRAVGYGLFADYGDSSVFRVVCLSRDAASGELRALFLSSSELFWADVAGVTCQTDLATSSRAMQANCSLYWRLNGGERMLAFSTASMEFSLLDLPPDLKELSFDPVRRGEKEDANVLHLLTMSGFRIEVWAGTADGDGGMAWKRVEKSVRFHKVMTEMINPSVDLYQHGLDVVSVAAGVVFLRQWNHLFSIDLETMKLKVLPSKDCEAGLIYPYTITWPPSFLNPAGQGA